MRARKLGAVTPEDSPPEDDIADPWPDDEVETPAGDDTPALVCLECGADGCRDHGDPVRLDTPSRAVRDAVQRLRRVAAEHRAATRALRALLPSVPFAPPAPERSHPEARAPAEPCPRCAIRDAEVAAGAPKPSARKAKRETGQQALPFDDGAASGPAPEAGPPLRA